MTVVRRAMAAALVVGLVILIARTYLDTGTAICRETVSAQGTAVRICGPAGLDDVPLIGLVVFAALLLLLPDLDEFGVAGVGSLKRRVEETERKQDELRSQLVQVAVQQVTQNLNLSLNLDLANTAGQHTLAQIRAGGVVSEPIQARAAQPVRSAVAEGRAALLNEWEEVYGMYALARYGKQFGASPPEYLEAWARLFEPQLESLYTLAQLIEHHPERVGPSDLDKARELLTTVRDGLNELERREKPEPSGTFSQEVSPTD